MHKYSVSLSNKVMYFFVQTQNDMPQHMKYICYNVSIINFHINAAHLRALSKPTFFIS